MRFRGVVGAFLLAAVALSGCASNDSKETPDVGVKPSVDPGGDLGSIAGVVTDPEQRFLGNVQLGLMETGDETQTDATGAFAFNGLAPGEYTIQIQRLGYEGTPKKATVTAGQVTAVDFVLVPLAVREPHYESFIQEGMIGCGTSTPVVTVITCYGSVFGGEDEDPFLVFNATKGARSALTEVTWESTSATTGKELLVRRNIAYDGEDFSVEGRHGGPSPIVFQTEFDDIEEIVEIVDDVFVNFFSQSNPSPVAYQQKFTAYFTVFYDMDMPEGFSAMPPS